MQARFHSAELLMHKGQILELGEAAWSVVTGICGTVWLTRDGDTTDNLLGPGQSLLLGRDGHALLSALGEARVRVEQGRQVHRGFLRRRLRGLRAAYLRFARSAKWARLRHPCVRGCGAPAWLSRAERA
jgi:hypothetical protein